MFHCNNSLTFTVGEMGTTGRFGAENDMLFCFNRTNLASILRIDLGWGWGDADGNTKVCQEATGVIQKEDGGDLLSESSERGKLYILDTHTCMSTYIFGDRYTDA